MAVNYGICPTCGKYYTSFSGSMGHSLGSCETMVDQKESVLALLEEEVKSAQDSLNQAQS